MVLCQESQKLPCRWRAKDPTGCKSRKSDNEHFLTEDGYQNAMRFEKKESCFSRLCGDMKSSTQSD